MDFKWLGFCFSTICGARNLFDNGSPTQPYRVLVAAVASAMARAILFLISRHSTAFSIERVYFCAVRMLSATLEYRSDDYPGRLQSCAELLFQGAR